MSNLIASLARRAIDYNYKAQREILKELKEAGHIVPKLNSSKADYDAFFLNTLISINDYTRLRLDVSLECLESQYTTALWSSTDDDDHNLDEPSLGYELSENAKACLDYDLLLFISLLATKLITLEGIEERTGQNSTQVAHDFWLTRNGHGAGFWDGDYEQDKLGDTLTALSEQIGSCDLCVGKDNLVYVY
jgi:hypothetical protein